LIQVKLINNYGFHWFSDKGWYVKGFCFGPDKTFYNGKSLLDYFIGISDNESFIRRVREANGIFSVLFTDENTVWTAVDRIRMFPIFYTSIKSDCYISDDAHYLKSHTGQARIDPLRSVEFLATGYVCRDRTLIDGIKQLQAGECFRYESGKIDRHFYFRFHTTSIRDHSYKKYRTYLNNTLKKIFIRLIKSIDSRTAVIPLSGGFDSRLIVTMLKQLGYSNVICYTYGDPSNPEVSISRQVAQKLGYPWHFVPYTENTIRDYMDSEEFKSYFPFSSSFVSSFFMQEYFAVRYLKDNKIIKDSSVFIPGHSGDFLAGSQLIKNGGIRKKASVSQIARQLYKQKYSLLKPATSFRNIFLQEIENDLAVYPQNTLNQFAYSIFEDWDIKEKISKLIFNSANVYLFFSYELRLPLWDSALLELSQDMPFEFKYNKRLYDDVLTNDIFSGFDLNFKSELQSSLFDSHTQYLKNIIKSLLPDFLYQSILRKNDSFCYHDITMPMVRDLESNSINVNMRGKNYNAIIAQWYLHWVNQLNSSNKYQA